MKVNNKDIIWSEKQLSVQLEITDYSYSRAIFDTQRSKYPGRIWIQAFREEYLEHILNIDNIKLYYLP